MLPTIFIAVALVGGIVFGFYAAHLYHTRRAKKNAEKLQENILIFSSTKMLEEELEKRKTQTMSVYR